MTVPTSTNKVSYSGNSSTVNFAIPFAFLEDSHIMAILRASSGTETTLTLTTDYTLAGAGSPSGGTLTATTAPATGTTLVITRNVPFTQETDYPANDEFPAESHENALDKLTMLCQQLEETIGRGLTFPITDSSSLSAELPNSTLRANKSLLFDATGAPMAGDLSDVAVSAAMTPVVQAATTAAALTALGAEGSTHAAATYAPLTIVGSEGSASYRNRITNGNFGINQRAVSGTVTLTAGQYGHDRWKAGASGCTYTFTTSGADTILTISAGSLQQVIEGANVEGGNYVMSWYGTAQGKIASGSYGASGVTASSVSAGSDLTVEFNTGTLSRVQLEAGTTATTYARRAKTLELLLCQYYYKKISVPNGHVCGIGCCQSTTVGWLHVYGTMRTTPTAAISGGLAWLAGNTPVNITSASTTQGSSNSAGYNVPLSTASGLTAGYGLQLYGNGSTGTLTLTAEL